jgi:ferric-dicitrate binding protein FerR (iron transport regulator)
LKQDSLTQLFSRYLNNQCSPEEIKTLLNHFEIKEDENLLKDLILQQLQADNSLKKEEEDTLCEVYLRIVEQIQIEKANGAKVVDLKRNRWWRYVAAAAVILLVASGVVYVWLEKKPENNLAKTQKPLPGNDVLPGGNKAVLTLADGSTIVLDNTAIGIVTQQGNTKVLKTNNGKLAYNTDRGKPVEVLYNTVSTPRGGQYQIELPDGSQVWLNAASSLRFPTAFIGKDRRVEITGEAYFEVTKNKSMPFIVSVEGSEIQVLGTHFNVMAYKEESNIKTTLLEGSIKFVHGNNSSLIKPGQQTQLANSGQIKVLDDIDMDAVIAWKNGNFDFNGVDIETVMRQLSRWYNVEVEYNKKTDVLFYAEIPRNTKLSEVLHALEYTSKVKFDINGKKIVVM